MKMMLTKHSRQLYTIQGKKGLSTLNDCSLSKRCIKSFPWRNNCATPYHMVSKSHCAMKYQNHFFHSSHGAAVKTASHTLAKRSSLSSASQLSSIVWNEYGTHDNNSFNSGVFSTLFLLGASLIYSTSYGISPNSTKQEEGMGALAANMEVPETIEKSKDEQNSNLDDKSLPTFKLKEVALRNGQNGTRIWMTYGGMVYDVTDFIANHPGGSEHILLAAGSSIEPFWNLYRQHFSTDLPMQYLEGMVIGILDEKDQEKIDEMLEKTYDENDPYKDEPIRHAALKIHGDQPMNAEVPQELITQNYLTPTELFYIRHHHPVPKLDAEDLENYRLEINLTALGLPSIFLTYKEIQSLPKHEVTATLQCSGNRRSNFNTVARTSGTPWGQGAISTAKFAGPRLRDVFKLAGLFDDKEDEAIVQGLDHVRFESLDGMKASIGLEKAISPYGDCILAYEMNGKPLPRDHGFPIRSIVPGYCAVRNVKWVKKIELSDKEAEGAWQRGLNYKVLPKKITNAKGVDLTKMPSLAEASLFSGITKLECVSPSSSIDTDSDSKSDSENEKRNVQPGSIVNVKASGWAWAGGGRNVVRINLTGDGGKTWTPAEITIGGDQKFNRAWAWVFWECDDIKAVVDQNGEVEVCSKAVDAAMNSQPEKCDHMWNIRGLGDNSWFRFRIKIN